MKDSEKETDSLLLKKLRKGDEQAFCQIFDQYHRYLYVLASRYLMSESYAEDAVQYTFMKLWEGRTFFDFRSGIRNLLFTILKNYVLNEMEVLLRSGNQSPSLSYLVHDIMVSTDTKVNKANVILCFIRKCFYCEQPINRLFRFNLFVLTQ